MSFALGLGLGTSFGGKVAFSPAALFAASEQGVWYDPSDFSTMFQDGAGTTPVTAVGQPVGLILDKSKILAISADVVTNGGFSADTNWTKGTNWTISGGQATHSGSISSNITQSSLTNGQWYVLTFDIVAITNGICRVRTNSGGATVASFTTTGSKTCYFQSVGAQLAFRAETNTSPITIDNVVCRPIAGNHATQTSDAARPVLNQEAGGQYYLAFDGTDDGLATGTIDFTATDKITLFAGVRKLSDAATGTIAELSSVFSSNSGTFALLASSDTAGTVGAFYRFGSRGTGAGTTSALQALASGYAAPVTNVMSATGDIAGSLSTIRVNTVAGTDGTGSQGTGNYGSYPLYIGRRGGTTLPFNGRLYNLIVLGRAATAAEISATEAWMNGKTGAY